MLFGGKTIASVRRLSWPLIVVPAKVKFTDLKKIGLACDFSDVIETIPAEEIGSLLQACSADLYVIHVSDEKQGSFRDEVEEEAGWLYEILKDYKPKYRFLEGKDVEKGIVEFAEKNKLDLLIVIPKKHGMISRLFRKSHSKRLVLQSHIPVMSIHE
jgi:nucleotide-binding universal stress UspA family protein